MTWKESLENVKFEIKTGDGKTFTPLWKNGSKSKSYNVANYNFINVAGGKTVRKQPQASKFPLAFWFVGYKNVELAQEFEDSANDKRPWEIKHPFYGDIHGQPVSISRNDSLYNVTEITVEFWESLTDDFPNSSVNIEDAATEKTEKVSKNLAKLYETKTKPTSKDVNKLNDFINNTSGSFTSLLDDTNFSEYAAKTAKAISSANNVVNDSLLAAEDIQQLALTPSTYSAPVKFVLNSLINAFERSKELLLLNPTVNDKLLFETQSGTIIAAMAQATVFPNEGDYVTSKDIEIITDLVVSTYNDYLLNIDSLQVNISDSLEVYIPDVISQTALYDLISEVTFSLYSLAFEAKQERRIELLTDSNLIILTHKYLGLDADDKNIEEFRQTNNIKMEEVFRIKKGREIKYFV